MRDEAPSESTVLRALHVSGFEYTSHLWWREDDNGALRIFINCSDFFAWGGSDLEEITDESIELLESTVAECEAIVGKYNADDAFLLWCARVRRRRPYSASYKALDPLLTHLFDEAETYGKAL